MVDLAVYPGNVFNLLLVVGVVFIRRRRSHAGLPRPQYRAWDIAIAFATLTNTYMLIAPWYPPLKGAHGGDVSFWYGTYLVVGIGLYVLIGLLASLDLTLTDFNRLLLCGVYYYVWIKVLPRVKGYELRQTVIEYENKSVVHHLVKVPKAEIVRWDEEHDAEGKLRRRAAHGSTDSQ